MQCGHGGQLEMILGMEVVMVRDRQTRVTSRQTQSRLAGILRIGDKAFQ